MSEPTRKDGEDVATEVLRQCLGCTAASSLVFMAVGWVVFLRAPDARAARESALELAWALSFTLFAATHLVGGLALCLLSFRIDREASAWCLKVTTAMAAFAAFEAGMLVLVRCLVHDAQFVCAILYYYGGMCGCFWLFAACGAAIATRCRSAPVAETTWEVEKQDSFCTEATHPSAHAVRLFV
ncbi:hypothetical protein DIPPA_06174 [Diplonema papillatum]|nr:hypothetical protein DIPPA_06174 [Diplonema papillatum]